MSASGFTVVSLGFSGYYLLRDRGFITPAIYIIALSILFLYYIFIPLWKSPLKDLPGPWYAPFTTIHLQYGFATGKIWKSVEKAHARYGPIVRLGPRQVWISDKESLKQILLTKDLPKVSMYSEISRDRTAPGLFGEIRPEPHRKLKRFLSPAFTVSYVDGLEFLFEKCTQSLLDKYETIKQANTTTPYQNGEKIDYFETDLMDDLHNVALDIMGECSFGKGFGQTNPDAEPEEGVAEKIWRSIPRSIFDNLAAKYQNVFIKRTARKLGINFNFNWSEEMVTAIEKMVQKRKNYPDTARPDVLQHLIEEGKRPDTGVRMEVQDVVDQMSELLLAGSETTSGTISCFFLEIARNPIVRRKLLVSLPLKHYSDPIISGKTIRNDPQFEYLNACIKECLRMHPIASEMGRRTGNDWVNLMGYDLPPHTVVSASYRSLHRDPEFWPQPNRFWPERWLTEDKMEGAAPPDMNAYYPFSAGKHSCIGINFAWAEMRIITANILSRYDIDEVPGQHVDWRQFITMQFATASWKTYLKARTISD